MDKKDQKRKTRAHRVLFSNDTLFKPQRVELKTRYQRQPKHRKQQEQNG